jgi:transcriptional regulator with XRE-family HTH domain
MGHSVADHCVRAELTVVELADRSGLELSRVQAIVLGRWTPSPSERQQIAKVLGVEASDVSWGHKTPIQHIYGHGPG